MIDAQPLRKQAILRFDHVDVSVAREFRMHPVARFARFAVTDPVWQHDEKFRGIKRLIFPEELAGKLRADKLRAAAGRPVHDENCIRRFALRIFLRFSERPVMETQLWQCFPRSKLEIANRVIALSRRRIIGGRCETRCQDR
jgi:hypothetical protein